MRGILSTITLYGLHPLPKVTARLPFRNYRKKFKSLIDGRIWTCANSNCLYLIFLWQFYAQMAIACHPNIAVMYMTKEVRAIYIKEVPMNCYEDLLIGRTRNSSICVSAWSLKYFFLYQTVTIDMSRRQAQYVKFRVIESHPRLPTNYLMAAAI